MAPAPTSVRVWVVGFGTVGQWLAGVLVAGRESLARRYGLEFEVVGLASRRDGFVTDPAGIDLEAALELRRTGRPLAELAGATRAATALEGIRESEADVLVEVGLSPAEDGEPGLSHMREALGRGLAVVTSNKWPVALAGAELAELAQANGCAFRAESTVMSGTPVLGPLTEGLAGAMPRALRGVLNATVNFMLTRIAEGASYEEALAQAQERGLAEPDPSADVDGHDAVAKLMILSALVFGRPLSVEQVARSGVSGLAEAQIDAARDAGRVLREVSSLSFGDGREVEARIQCLALEPHDPLARVDGTTNGVICEVEPLGKVAIAGPGAGIELAGQGVFSDLITVGRELARARR